MNDDQIADRIGGCAAICAGGAWFLWALISIGAPEVVEANPDIIGPRLAKVGPLLTATWNLLLIPAALCLYGKLSPRAPALVLHFTVSGVLAFSFWAFGGLTRISPQLEITYLFLAAIWWLGIGSILWRQRRWLAVFTLVVGALSALDAILSFLEPIPYAIYVLAAPKLPLCALWSIAMGLALWRWQIVAGDV